MDAIWLPFTARVGVGVRVVVEKEAVVCTGVGCLYRGAPAAAVSPVPPLGRLSRPPERKLSSP